MYTNQRFGWIFTVSSITVFSMACNFLTQFINPAEQKSKPQAVDASSTANVPPDMGESTPFSNSEEGTVPAPDSGSMALIRQWASQAEASSQYGSEDWAAFQAVGEPNTADCGDYSTAWAAASSDTREWMMLFYPRPVYAVEVNIYQTYNPDQIVSVDLIDLSGNFVNVYTAEPRPIETCPYILTLPTAFSGILAQGVRITIDQSLLNLGWNEIDAVEMIGAPGEGTPIRPKVP
ncbi:MAG: hypothetical protein DDG59_07760 [Anaerolineae bacterium]|jgi:hypothetical protein|nr:MAG: hypothetical protein DDG59_07760 [Anaerolineae bacterium]